MTEIRSEPSVHPDTEISYADFAAARNKALAEPDGQGGIGTLSEKLTHRILKLYIDPREENHEIPFMDSIADIKNEYGIFEIQTASFDKIVPKLKKFLPHTKVTLVYPVFGNKTVYWCDKNGEISSPRKSPKKGTAADVLPEASRLGQLLTHENFTLRVFILSAEEYKLLDGWDNTCKRGATRLDRIPLEPESVIDLSGPNDYSAILPESLPDTFTSKDFNRLTHLRGRRAYFSLKLLESLGVVRRAGNRGRAFLYEKCRFCK